MRVAQLRKLLPGLIPLLAATPAAKAGTETAVLNVTATVLSSCTIEGGTLDFGQYVTGQTGDLDGVGEITLTNCQGQVTIAMDGGTAGSVSARKMANAGNTLDYQLYRDPSRSQVWGEGGQAFLGQILASQATLQVFGRIPGGQSVPPGVYTDTVNITLTF